MPDSSQLPHLIALLEDDSPMVREEVTNALLAYGPGLESALRDAGVALNARQTALLKELIGARAHDAFLSFLRDWRRRPDKAAKLESGLAAVAVFIGKAEDGEALPGLLDDLHAEFQRRRPDGDVRDLARFLFEELEFKGEHDDYYAPANSNLASVISRRRGIPITLACLYQLVGARAGLDIWGCNWPGNFLAGTEWRGERYLVDCYTGGTFVQQEPFIQAMGNKMPGARRYARNRAAVNDILRRVLKNAEAAYAHQANFAKSHAAAQAAALFLPPEE